MDGRLKVLVETLDLAAIPLQRIFNDGMQSAEQRQVGTSHQQRHAAPIAFAGFEREAADEPGRQAADRCAAPARHDPQADRKIAADRGDSRFRHAFIAAGVQDIGHEHDTLQALHHTIKRRQPSEPSVVRRPPDDEMILAADRVHKMTDQKTTMT
jgi:hypothetical protein